MAVARAGQLKSGMAALTCKYEFFVVPNLRESMSELEWSKHTEPDFLPRFSSAVCTAMPV